VDEFSPPGDEGGGETEFFRFFSGTRVRASTALPMAEK
jgi:hypothetical protein